MSGSITFLDECSGKIYCMTFVDGLVVSTEEVD